MSAPTDILLADAAEAWLVAARAGVIRTRGGDPYKPSALRTYTEALEIRLLPAFGHLRMSSLTRNHVQRLIDDLVGRGLAPSTVRNTILPLRAICRRALLEGVVTTNPTLHLCLPALRSSRDRVARPEEATALIQAVPERDRALWATAIYAGLRRGELQALMWDDIDFERGIVHVRRSWDRVAGIIEPKSRAGHRRVPLATVLRGYLLAHRRAHPFSRGYVFPSKTGQPFSPAPNAERARRAWAAAGLSPIQLHECRHTYASLMIAAGVSAKALSTYMGHSTITLTLDRYGHLLPGNEDHAAALLDRFLAAPFKPPTGAVTQLA